MSVTEVTQRRAVVAERRNCCKIAISLIELWRGFECNRCLRQLSLYSPVAQFAESYSPGRYATNRIAKVPSITATAVIATVRFAGPKKISTTMANFSMTAAVKIGARVAGKYAL